jgi:aldose 1-epimerase
MTINSASFGTMKTGKTAKLISLTNGAGLTAKFSDYGATWVTMLTPDIKGQPGDVLLGFDDVSGYELNPFISSVVGRYANRISDSCFSLNGKQYQLDVNEAPHHLHGGTANLSVKVWHSEVDTALNLLRFTCESLDGESGYPGNLKLEIIYQLNEESELVIQYRATTDKPTIINLTNHAYFNLADSNTVSNHELQLDTDKYTPVDGARIPTGQIEQIPESLDFRQSASIGEKIHQRTKLGEHGLDHNLVFSDWDGSLTHRGKLYDPDSGRTLLIKTTEPAVQIYTGNHLQGIRGKQNRVYHRHAGVCLETQHFPDSPNQPNFPSTLLTPEQSYTSTTVFQFKTNV